MEDPGVRATLRSLSLPVLTPTFLLGFGEGAVLPFIVLVAIDRGMSPAGAGFVFSLAGIFRLLSSMPASALIARIGERGAMSVSTVILLVSLAGCTWTRSPAVLAVSVAGLGVGWAVWHLARITYVTEVVPVSQRGRVLSVLGGIQRIARLFGPLAAAGAIQLVGLEGAFYAHMVASVAGMIALLTMQDVRTKGLASGTRGVRVFLALARDHLDTLKRAGVLMLLLGIVRSSRDAAIPLWAEHIGVDPSRLGVIIATATALEILLFYPGGVAMDRIGRHHVAVPCMLLLGTALMVLPLSSGPTSLLLVALLASLGNGIGTGIVTTMGSDAAPPDRRAEFLGMWRMVTDVGQAGGPLLLAAVSALVSLAAGSIVVGSVGVVGAGIAARRIATGRTGPQGSVQ